MTAKVPTDPVDEPRQPYQRRARVVIKTELNSFTVTDESWKSSESDRVAVKAEVAGAIAKTLLHWKQKWRQRDKWLLRNRQQSWEEGRRANTLLGSKKKLQLQLITCNTSCLRDSDAYSLIPAPADNNAEVEKPWKKALACAAQANWNNWADGAKAGNPCTPEEQKAWYKLKNKQSLNNWKRAKRNRKLSKHSQQWDKGEITDEVSCENRQSNRRMKRRTKNETKTRCA